jgi:cytochrome c-type biogenesis protein CcmH
MIMAASVILLVLVVPIVTAQDDTPQTPAELPSDDSVNTIAAGVYCPVCENVPLDVCQTEVCSQWRELIRQQLALGWSDQQIRDYFVVTYGDQVLAEPPKRGLHWLAYFAPLVIFSVALILAGREYMRSREAGAAPSDLAAPVNGDYLARIEGELRDRERE